MKKLIVSLSLLAMLSSGSFALNETDNNEVVIANAEESTITSYFDDYLDSNGLVDYQKVYDAGISEASSAILGDFSYTDDFIKYAVDSGRLENYVAPGGTMVYAGYSSTNESDTYQVWNHDAYSEDFYPMKEHQYFALTYNRVTTHTELLERYDYVPLIFEGANFFNNPPEDESVGWGYIINFMISIMEVGEEFNLIAINDSPILKLVKGEDGQAQLATRGCLANFDTNKQNLYIDLKNVGFISSVSVLEMSYGHYDDAIQASSDTLFRVPTEAYKTMFANYPYSIVDYDHKNALLTVLKNRRLDAGDILFIQYSDLDSNRRFRATTEKISETVYNNLQTYKINYDSHNLTTHDFRFEMMALDANSNGVKINQNVNKTYRYINNDVHHRLAVEAHVDHFGNYSKLWFNLTDLEYKTRILQNMADLTFIYYEERNDWEKSNAKDLVRSVIHDRSDFTNSAFAYVLSLYNRVNGTNLTVDDLTYEQKYGILQMIESSHEDFIDNYGREWNLKYTRNNTGNQVEQWFSGTSGKDWELYTSYPANLVWWNPASSIVYVSYTTKDGTTVKCSSYEDGLYAEMIDGEWVVKDVTGNVRDDVVVLENGILADKDGGLIESDTTNTTGQGDDPFSQLIDTFGPLIIKTYKGFLDMFSAKNLWKTCLVVALVVVVIAVGYLIYTYIKYDMINRASGKKKKKKK